MPSVSEKLTPQLLPGPSFTFTFPESVRQLPGDPRTIKMQLPSTLAELEANAIGGLSIKMTYELITRAVVEIDGKPVDQAMPWFDAVGPKCRTRLVGALNTITMPDNAERDSFLGSMEKTG